ncbi:hypothetical protein IQ249_20605 [Lusitaniella coriacea LEGE 07157]|uniref:Uncharacterized protein n=2 Tax=Lusitaniella TaxID=1983104 RepID=A0A8J7DZ64_9CYAN|nr:hypothetical protein [Lusitaniella coriacea LEGE 07157]
MTVISHQSSVFEAIAHHQDNSQFRDRAMPKNFKTQQWQVFQETYFWSRDRAIPLFTSQTRAIALFQSTVISDWRDRVDNRNYQ